MQQLSRQHVVLPGRRQFQRCFCNRPQPPLYSKLDSAKRRRRWRDRYRRHADNEVLHVATRCRELRLSREIGRRRRNADVPVHFSRNICCQRSPQSFLLFVLRQPRAGPLEEQHPKCRPGCYSRSRAFSRLAIPSPALPRQLQLWVSA